MQAPPLSRNYSLVGNAFDYLLRFHVKRLNPGAHESEWIAETVASHSQYFDGNRDWIFTGGKIRLDPQGERDQRRARLVVKEARRHHAAFLRNGSGAENLLRSALLLAQLDPLLRASGINFSWRRADLADVRDLRRLLSVVEPRHFRTKRVCVLNPRFGEASELVGGADADLLLDGSLIEIKTTKLFEVKREWFDQLLGYYLLSRLDGIEGVDQRHRVTRLGIYFSRHGYLWTFKVQEVVDERRLPAMARWFVKRASREFS